MRHTEYRHLQYFGILLLMMVSSLRVGAAVGAITGVNAVCVGSHRVLTDTTTGGVWSSSNTTLATIDAAGRVTGLAAGIDTISYTVGSVTVFTAFTVNPLPHVYTVTGGGSYCAGGKGVIVGLDSSDFDIIYYLELLTVSGTVIGGDAVGGNGSAMGFGRMYDSGTYFIIASDYLTGCHANMNGSVTVRVLQVPAPIVGDTVLCAGSTVHLYDSTHGGQWTSKDATVATVDSTGLVTGVSGYSVPISYTGTNGCAVSKIVTVLPDLLPDITYNWLTNTMFTDAGFISYQWYDSLQGLIPGATSPSVAALYSGYYYVVVNNSDGCQNESPHLHFNIDELGASHLLNNEKVMLYPNPVHHSLMISATEKIGDIQIINTKGQTVYSSDNNVSNSASLDLTKLLPGTYYLQLNGTVVRTLVKE